MAKMLIVEFQEQPVNLALEKIDRTKLYGYIDTEVVDDTGKPCELGTLLGDGHSLVGMGGTGLAYLSHDGLWCKKSELRPVDRHGTPITPVRSTFDAVVKLDEQATIDEYLSHNITLIYQMTPVGEHTALMQQLRGGTIFKFPFSYRGGVVASAGFLLLGSDGNIFLCVGIPTAIEFVGLKATAPVLTEAEDAPAEEEIDFSF